MRDEKEIIDWRDSIQKNINDNQYKTMYSYSQAMNLVDVLNWVLEDDYTVDGERR